MKEVAFVVFLALLVLVSDAKVTKPNTGNFLRCLRNRTGPVNPITDVLFTPGNSTFVSSYVSYTKNKRFSNPKDTNLIAIIAAKHGSHVRATVVCAKSNGIQIRIRSGGHDYEGLSYISSVPFVILDMQNLRSIIVDVSSKTAWVEAGAILGELYTKIAEASKTLAFPAGVCPSLGAGGHISGGGYGNLIRKYGISVDHVVDAHLVDVNGKVLNRASMGEDLFWAIRGGGGASFGVVLSWKINLVEVPKTLTVFKVNKTLEQGATDVLYKWQLVSSKLPKELFLRAMPQIANGKKSGDKTVAVKFIAQFLGSPKKLMAIINKNLPELGLKREDCYEMSWLNTTTFWADYPLGTPTSVLVNRPSDPPGAFFKSKSDYVKKPIPKEGMEKIWKTMLKFNNLWMQWNPYGGVMDEIPSNATAFPHRKGNLFKIQYFAFWTNANATDANIGLMKELYDVAKPYVSSNPRETFLNYRDIDVGSNPSGETNVDEAKIYGSKYFLGNLKRLMGVKAKYDPENFFKYEQSIPPLRAIGGGLIAYSDQANASYSKNGVETGTRKKKVVLLGTGWAGASFLKDLSNSSYEVQVISPRNYFAFTPLLPSVTCGTVEARSVVEPVRNIGRKNVGMSFLEAECFRIDPGSKKVYCRSKQGVDSKGKKQEFDVDYDYLVIATGAESNTFNIPGVEENCHFLKEVEDAQRIRRTVIDSFEKASLPDLKEEERKRMLHFVVVGGGPTGVEFASELHDFVTEDLVKLYPKAKNLVQITLLEAADHILTMFDKRITEFAEEKFGRDGVNVKLGSMVVKVNDKEISAKTKGGEVSTIPYGMIVWSTGIGTRPVIKDFMKQIGQGNRRALATNEWLRVEGCDNIYALGDCATINQRKVMEDIAAIFKKADKDKSGTLTVKEFQQVMDDICVRYPQIELYLKSKGMRGTADLLTQAEENGSNKSIKEVDIEELKAALSQVDSQVKFLPATGQVAAQQGTYLAKCFDRMEECEKKPEGPIRIRGEGRHRFRPFRYRHLGQFAPLGGEQTAAQLPGDWVSIGHSSQWLWYSVYASKQVSWRTRVLVVSDWMRRFIFGRDSSRI